ncbi:MAG: agmatinase, partial [Deltaproteobacteria bacterium]|nr:agmatinase [Deltaproteobacteria bacterium]
TGILWEQADVLIQPIPNDSTTSFQPGTRFGPEALLQASRQVELWDEALQWEPFHRYRCLTLNEIPPNHRGPDSMAADIRAALKPYRRPAPLLTAIGGEHSITLPLVESLRENHPGLVLCWLDAHADLRDEWEGSRFSHACVLRRIAELGLPVFHLGLRSLSREEQEYLQDQRGIRAYSSEELLLGQGFKRFKNDLESRPDPDIYLSVDVDVFDPGLLPGTGTPEPGGLSWYSVLEAVRLISNHGTIRGLDLCELMPIPGSRQSEFIAAKLIFKILSMVLYKKEKGAGR